MLERPVGEVFECTSYFQLAPSCVYHSKEEDEEKVLHTLHRIYVESKVYLGPSQNCTIVCISMLTFNDGKFQRWELEDKSVMVRLTKTVFTTGNYSSRKIKSKSFYLKFFLSQSRFPWDMPYTCMQCFSVQRLLLLIPFPTANEMRCAANFCCCSDATHALLLNIIC